MTTGSDSSDVLPPEEAFDILGNGTRIRILEALAEDAPQRFTDLRRNVGVDDSGRFNYHLNQLVGHFVDRRDGGYRLSQPGRRVIQAVLSGAVTDSPELERTPIDWSCHLCGTEPIEIEYTDEQVGVYCSHCDGVYGGDDGDAPVRPADRERLYYMHLPPAGVTGRSPEEVFMAASRWTNAEATTAASGICPRCSARLVESAVVCRNHSAESGRCDHCNNRFAVAARLRCTNCVFDIEVMYPNKLQSNVEFREFLIDEGINPLHPQSEAALDVFHHYEEEIESVDPLEVTFTFFGEEESISLTVDDALTVVDVERREVPE